MSEQQQVKILKKRGRKPKNKVPEVIIIKEEIQDTEKEVIITYLPININDLDIHTENNEKDNEIFIKSEIYYSDSINNQIDLKKNKKPICQIISSSDSEYKLTSINNNFNKCI